MSSAEQHGRRTAEITAEVRVVDHMKKEAKVAFRDLVFTIACDEGPHIGGEGSAPTPMQYFVAAIGF